MMTKTTETVDIKCDICGDQLAQLLDISFPDKESISQVAVALGWRLNAPQDTCEMCKLFGGKP